MSSTLTTSYAVAQLQTGESVTQNTVTQPFNFTHQTASANAPISNGTAAGQAQKTWTNTITVNTTGTTLDLTALTGGLDGGTRNFTSITSWLIENLDGTNSINVGNAATNGWLGINNSATVLKACGPGGWIGQHEPTTAGLATAGGNKSVLIAAAAATVSVKITFIGRGT